MIKIFLRKTYCIDKISSSFSDDVYSLGRHFDIYIPRLSVRGLQLFFMVPKYLPPMSVGHFKVQTIMTGRIFFPLTANGT